jgi:hypothetical protein
MAGSRAVSLPLPGNLLVDRLVVVVLATAEQLRPEAALLLLCAPAIDELETLAGSWGITGSPGTTPEVEMAAASSRVGV